MWACLVHLCTMPPKYLNSATYSRTAPLYDSMVAQARVRGSSISVVLGPRTQAFPTLRSLKALWRAATHLLLPIPCVMVHHHNECLIPTGKE